MSKIFKGFHLFLINPILFFKYLWERRKRLLPEWFLKPKSKIINKKIGDILFEIDLDIIGWNFYSKQILFDCYEIATAEVIKTTLKKGDIFIDVGANIGYFSALAVNLVGKNGKVYSFEPIPLNFESLKRFKELNGGYNVILNEIALSDKTGRAEIDFLLPPHASGSSMVSVAPFPQKTINIDTIRLDDYIKENKIDNISLIKIDVEGYEFFVLKGLEGYFQNTSYRPLIICEICPNIFLGKDKLRKEFMFFGKDTRKELLKFMKQYGYEAYNIMNPKIRVDITKFKEAENVVFKAQSL